MCLYPRLIDNPKYKRNKKNGGIIPPLTDQRVKKVPIGCDTCKECRDKKSRDWQTRLQEDIKTYKNGIFVTLTFNTESLIELIKPKYTILKRSKHKEARAPWRRPIIKHKRHTKHLDKLKGYELDNAICIKATRLFLERWRKKYGKSLRHWLITEIGGQHSEHVHMHGIVWTNNPEELENIWQYGYLWRGYKTKEKNKEIIIQNYVSAKTINYITKYITKIDEKHLNYKPIILCTPGIGEHYTTSYNSTKNKFNDKKTDETYRTSTGHKMALPIYWRNKIYSENERENLWLIKLDKGERYVCKEKINADDEETYYNVLEYHRANTIKLGYPRPEFIWSKKNYEEQRRQLLQEKRLKKPSRNDLSYIT